MSYTDRECHIERRLNACHVCSLSYHEVCMCVCTCTCTCVCVCVYQYKHLCTSTTEDVFSELEPLPLSCYGNGLQQTLWRDFSKVRGCLSQQTHCQCMFVNCQCMYCQLSVYVCQLSMYVVSPTECGPRRLVKQFVTVTIMFMLWHTVTWCGSVCLLCLFVRHVALPHMQPEEADSLLVCT